MTSFSGICLTFFLSAQEVSKIHLLTPDSLLFRLDRLASDQMKLDSVRIKRVADSLRVRTSRAFHFDSLAIVNRIDSLTFTPRVYKTEQA